MKFVETENENLVWRICVKGETPTDEEIGSLGELKNLDLSGKDFDSIDLSRLTGLRKLLLKGTRFKNWEGIDKLTELNVLDLGETQITDLSSLKGLTNLRKLYLSGAIRVSSFEFLSALTDLEALNLSRTQIDSLEPIRDLSHLQTLDLSRTLIDSLEPLCNLKSLQTLNLSGTQNASLESFRVVRSSQTFDLREVQITNLRPLKRLVNLRKLYLGGMTRVNSFEFLSALTNLQELDLSGTQLVSLEPLRNLRSLQTLNVSETQITSLDSLESLKGLKRLDISGTTLDRIPYFLVKMALRFITESSYKDDSGILMEAVKLSKQNASLFAQKYELIKKYYDYYENDLIPVNEARVIVLGDGGEGKTFTIYGIENDGTSSETETTQGVCITQLVRKQKSTINFWDFGGQEIMYSMHRQFMAERVCYLVVVSNHRGDVDKRVRKWLKRIQRLAPDSKVIIAVNLWEGVQGQDLNEENLKKEYPGIVEVVKYAATTSDGIRKLRSKIEEVVDSLPCAQMKFPESWVNVMEKLRDAMDPSDKSANHIMVSEYLGICDRFEIGSRDISRWLLDWFNDLGVCFGRIQDDTKDWEKIWNPSKLTNAVYRIINYDKLPENGCVSCEEVLKILNPPDMVNGEEYTQNDINCVWKFTRKAGLSCDADNGYEFAPVLYRKNIPEDFHPENFKTHIRCSVRYKEYLPEEVIQRLMVELFKESELSNDKCGLKGFCVDKGVSKGLSVVCEVTTEVDDEGKDVDVLRFDAYQVEGTSKPQSLLRSLLDRLERINREINIETSVYFYPNDERGVAFSISSILFAWSDGIKNLNYSGGERFVQYPVQALAGQVFEELAEINPAQISENERELIIGTYIQDVNFIQASFVMLLELKRQLEQFRDECNKLTELDEDQKSLLYDAVGDLIDSLYYSEERQTKYKDRFRRTLKVIGISFEQALEIISKFQIVYKYLNQTLI